MDITLDYLKKLWNEKRIERIQKEGMHLSSGIIFFKQHSEIWPEIDAVWESRNLFEVAINRRKRQRKKYGGCQHIFISEICDIAVEEYLQVAEIIGNNKITLYIESYQSYFLSMSRKYLKEHFKLNYYNVKRGELTASAIMI